MVADYGPIAIFLVIAIGFAVAPLVLARLLRPSNPNAIKQSSYECGIETAGTSWIRYYAGFYVYALLFVIFDVETVFLYSLGSRLRKTGTIRPDRDVHLHRYLGVWAWCMPGARKRSSGNSRADGP